MLHITSAVITFLTVILGQAAVAAAEAAAALLLIGAGVTGALALFRRRRSGS